MKRIVFIDLVRAYAILSMIQGHLISGVLAREFHNPDSLLYNYWNFNRGITAPVFFFISGLIFTYLLFKNNKAYENNSRVKKGIKRASLLILTGYILQFNVSFLTELPYLKFLEFQTMFMSHVLHCIGFGLFFIMGLFYLNDKLKIPFWFTASIASVGIFLIEPLAIKMSWIHYIPLPLATYLNRDFSSIFPLIPWLGFVSWGGLLGYIIFKFPSIVKSYYSPLILTTLAVLFKIYRYSIYETIYVITKSDTIHSLMNYDYTFYHLPHVLIVISIFMLIAKIFKNIPKSILTIGQNTLFIYIIHVLILYGNTFFPGVVPRYKYSLNPIESILLAVIIEAVIIFFVLNKNKIWQSIQNFYLYLILNLNYYKEKILSK